MSLLSDEHLLQVIRGTHTGYPHLGPKRGAPALTRRRGRWLHRFRRQSSRGDAMPRLYDATAEAIDRRIGWDKLPLLLAMPVLIGLRNVLRKKNLYDTGRGPLDKPDVDDHPQLPDRAHARRHVQQPRRPADGQPRQPLRPQRAARAHRAREGPARAEPAHGQPRAADAQGVHPGDDAQPARRRVDPVRGARLVQPRQERDARTRGSCRSPTTTRGPSTRCRSSARAPTRAPTRTARRRSSPTTRTGGTARRSTAATRRSPRRSAPASTASCVSTSAA